MADKRNPGALAGATEAETETAKFQAEYSLSRQFRQARTRHIADIVAGLMADIERRVSP